MRGIFTAGVLDVFVERSEPPFDVIVGVSAGACCAASYLARQPKRNYFVFLELMTGPAFINVLRGLRGGSLVDMSFLMGPVARNLYPLDIDTLRGSSCRFEVVATEARSATATYLPATDDDCIEALHTTICVPVFYKGSPSRFRGKSYFDGALADPVPLTRAISLGATDITIVLTRPRAWQSKPVTRLTKLILERTLADYPSILDAVLHYDRTQREARSFLDNGVNDVTLRVLMPPDDFPVKRFTRDRSILHTGYMMGKQAAERA